MKGAGVKRAIGERGFRTATRLSHRASACPCIFRSARAARSLDSGSGASCAAVRAARASLLAALAMTFDVCRWMEVLTISIIMFLTWLWHQCDPRMGTSWPERILAVNCILYLSLAPTVCQRCRGPMTLQAAESKIFRAQTPTNNPPKRGEIKREPWRRAGVAIGRAGAVLPTAGSGACGAWPDNAG